MLARVLLSALALTGLTQTAVAAPIVKRDFTGEATYYAVGLGACGDTNSDSEFVVAMNWQQYDGSCGKTVTISYGGKTTSAKVVDKCPGCKFGDLDMSPSLFSYFADQGVGRFVMSWSMGGGGGGDAPAPPKTTEAPPPPPPPPTSTYTSPPPPTSEYTPPPTSEYTPPPTSTYTPPASTYTPPAPSSQAPPSPSLDVASSAAPSAQSSAAPSSASSVSPSASGAISASSNSTSTLSSSASVSPLHVTVSGSSAAAATTAPVDNVVSTTATDAEASGNLPSFNNFVAALGRIVVLAAQ